MSAQPHHAAAVKSRTHRKTYWRMLGRSKKPLTCSLYQTEAGFEVRAEFSEQHLLLSQLVYTELAADTYAAAWKAVVELKGGVADGAFRV